MGHKKTPRLTCAMRRDAISSFTRAFALMRLNCFPRLKNQPEYDWNAEYKRLFRVFLKAANEAAANPDSWALQKLLVQESQSLLDEARKSLYKDGDLEKFFGCCPRITGDLSTEEFIAKVRGKTDDQTPPMAHNPPASL